MKLIKTNNIYFYIFKKYINLFYKQVYIFICILSLMYLFILSWNINKRNHKSPYTLTFPYMIISHVRMLNTKTNEGPVLSTSPYRHGEHEGPYNTSQPRDYTNPQSFFLKNNIFKIKK